MGGFESGKIMFVVRFLERLKDKVQGKYSYDAIKQYGFNYDTVGSASHILTTYVTISQQISDVISEIGDSPTEKQLEELKTLNDILKRI